MNCERALDRMLEAEPAELRGEGGTELARHIRGCPRCQRTAGVLVAELSALDAALDAYAEEGDPEVAADAALAAIRAGSVPGRARPHRGGRMRATRGLAARLGAGLGLAAAAALAALLLRGPSGPTPPPPSAAGSPDPREPAVAVTPPPGRGAAVLQTRNPDITVVWLYDREES